MGASLALSRLVDWLYQYHDFDAAGHALRLCEWGSRMSGSISGILAGWSCVHGHPQGCALEAHQADIRCYSRRFESVPIDPGTLGSPLAEALLWPGSDFRPLHGSKDQDGAQVLFGLLLDGELGSLDLLRRNAVQLELGGAANAVHISSPAITTVEIRETGCEALPPPPHTLLVRTAS